jgi:hypothetical protein
MQKSQKKLHHPKYIADFIEQKSNLDRTIIASLWRILID